MIRGVERARPSAGAPAKSPQADAAAALPLVTPSIEHTFLACALLPSSAATPSKARAPLAAAGFVEKAPAYFAHRDGSWVAFSNGRVYRGVGEQRFNGYLNAPRQLVRYPVDVQHLTLAIADPALAALDPAKPRSMDEKLRAQGFVKRNATFWQHADASFVAITRGKIVFGHGRSTFTGQPSATALPQRAPQASDHLAAALLWCLPAEPKAFVAALRARGFSETKFGHFVSGVYFAGVRDGQTYVGMHSARFSKAPGPGAMKTAPSEAHHRWLAVTKTKGLDAETRGLGSELAQLGFTAGPKGVFTHADGSWVVVSDGELLRGAGNVQLTSLLDPPQAGEVPVYDKLPARTWSWFAANTALGRTPRLSGAGAASVLASLGYQPPAQGQSRWQHPDGSWFEINGQFVRPGFQKWHLGQLPFNNRRPG